MSEPIIPTDLLSTTEAAALVSVSPVTIRQWAASGKLPAFKIGSRIRVSRADVLAMMQRVEHKGPRLRTKAEAEAEEAVIDAILRRARIRP